MPQHQREIEALIRTFVPINGLSGHHQDELLRVAQVHEFSANQYIFREGERDNHSYYLLRGELELYSKQRLVQHIAARTEEARHALSQLQPRQFTAISRTDVAVLVVERDLLDRFLVLSSGRSEQRVEVDDIETTEQGDWMTRVLRSKLFARIPAVNIQQIFSHMESVALRAGDVVIRQGDPGDFYYIIQEGRCAVTRRNSTSPDPVRLAELGDGDSFGEEALLSDAPRNATVTMLSEGRLMRLTKAAFDELIRQPALRGVDASQARALSEGGACWLDVRFPDERQASHIPDDLHIPLYALRMALPRLDAEARYIAYCDSGSRSSVGAFLLTQHGFEAYFLEGGLANSPVSLVTADGRPAPRPSPIEAAAPPPVAQVRTASSGQVGRQRAASEDLDKAMRVIRALKAELQNAREQRDAAVKQREQAQAELEATEQRMEIAFQARLAGERERLTHELLRTSESAKEAKEWRRKAAEAQRKAAEKAEQMLAEFQEGQEALMETREAAFNAETRRLEREIETLRRRLQEAEAANRAEGRDRQAS